MAVATEIFMRVGDAEAALVLLDQLLGMNAGVMASVPLLRRDQMPQQHSTGAR